MDSESSAGSSAASSTAPPGRRVLYREPEDKKIAGVCGGLADYTGIDPAIVRAATILVAVLQPLLIVAYLVAIFVIDNRPPTVGRVTAPQPEFLERHTWLPIALIAVAILVGVDGPWWWWPDMPLAAPLLIGVGVWLFARSRSGGTTPPAPGAPGTPGSGGPPGSGPAPGPFDPSTDRPQTVVDRPTQTPWSSPQDENYLSLGVDITTRNEDAGPTVDRTADLRAAAGDDDDDAGAGGFASTEIDPEPRSVDPRHTESPLADEGAGPPGGLPPLTPPEWSGPEPPAVAVAGVGGRGSERLGLLVTSVLLIGGGTAWFINTTDIADVDPRHVLAVGLIVVGLALVLAAWRGRARAALIPLALLAAAALASAEVVDVPLDAGMGERTVTVDSRTDLGEPIELLAGDLVVDLRNTRLSTTRLTTVRAGVGVGKLRVLVPRSTNLVVEADVRAGAVEGALRGVDQDADAGVLLDETYELAGTRGGADVRLVLDVGIGQAEVVRG
jgi:phage shock protein PspC (stress-responsive transcriptional regulator)